VRKKTEPGTLMRGKSQDELDKVSSTPEKPELNVPLVEALFLPDFPIKGDAQGQDFEVLISDTVYIVLQSDMQGILISLHFTVV
jgi:hypothetical protein